MFQISWRQIGKVTQFVDITHCNLQSSIIGYIGYLEASQGYDPPQGLGIGNQNPKGGLVVYQFSRH